MEHKVLEQIIAAPDARARWIDERKLAGTDCIRKAENKVEAQLGRVLYLPVEGNRLMRKPTCPRSKNFFVPCAGLYRKTRMVDYERLSSSHGEEPSVENYKLIM